MSFFAEYIITVILVSSQVSAKTYAKTIRRPTMWTLIVMCRIWSKALKAEESPLNLTLFTRPSILVYLGCFLTLSFRLSPDIPVQVTYAVGRVCISRSIDYVKVSLISATRWIKSDSRSKLL